MESGTAPFLRPGQKSVGMTDSGLTPLRTVAVVGVGLIGGSVGLAIRQRGLARRVVGVGHRQSSLDRALALGAVDEATLDIQRGTSEAELTILATPIGTMVELATAAREAMPRGSMLTDVGSTKSRLVRQLEEVAGDRLRYVGAHPMAGSEKRGVEEADPGLFGGALCFMTPTPRTDPRATELVMELWQALGARVRIINPAEHDRLVALASHVPHLVAAALVNVTTPEAMTCVGSGFRDTTRVASGDPRLWVDVCLHNILHALRKLGQEIDTLSDILVRGAAAELLAWLQSAKAVRDCHMRS